MWQILVISSVAFLFLAVLGACFKIYEEYETTRNQISSIEQHIRDIRKRQEELIYHNRKLADELHTGRIISKQLAY